MTAHDFKQDVQTIESAVRSGHSKDGAETLRKELDEALASSAGGKLSQSDRDYFQKLTDRLKKDGVLDRLSLAWVEGDAELHDEQGRVSVRDIAMEKRLATLSGDPLTNAILDSFQVVAFGDKAHSQTVTDEIIEKDLKQANDKADKDLSDAMNSDERKQMVALLRKDNGALFNALDTGENGKPDGKIDKDDLEEIYKQITLNPDGICAQAFKGCESLIKNMIDNFKAYSASGYITKDSLAKKIGFESNDDFNARYDAINKIGQPKTEAQAGKKSDQPEGNKPAADKPADNKPIAAHKSADNKPATNGGSKHAAAENGTSTQLLEGEGYWHVAARLLQKDIHDPKNFKAIQDYVNKLMVLNHHKRLIFGDSIAVAPTS